MSTPATQIREHSFEWGKRTYLMGVLNVTPDSFSDGGEFNTVTAALLRAQQMVADGVDIIDIGGQSTRPGAEEIPLEAELERVLPILHVLRQELSVPISVDTTRAAVAIAVTEKGADLVNDISSGTFDPDMLSTVAQLGIPIVLMHIRGTPKTMQQMTEYQELIGEVRHFLNSRISAATTAGIDRSQIIIDPGIGFAKTSDQNLEILRRLDEFHSLQCPILVGPSRKGFIGRILNQPDPKARIWGTAAACCAAISSGADLLRVHDVREMRDACRVADAIFRGDR